jgi:hypothetical protein
VIVEELKKQWALGIEKPLHVVSGEYYVYEHWRSDRNECFYVGKGKKFRAYTHWNRNKTHRSITEELSRNGYGFDVRLVFTGLSNEDALRIEEERIAFWRNDGAQLANITAGGLGTYGMKFSAATRAKMSADRKGRPLSESHRQNMIKGLTGLKKSPEHAAKVAAAIAGINRGRKHKPEHVAERLATCLKRNPNHFYDIAKTRAVVCVNDGRWYPSQVQAANAYGIGKGAVHDVCKGNTRHTISGLVFVYEDRT